MAWQPVDFLQNLLAPVSDEEDTEEEEASEEEVLAFFPFLTKSMRRDNV